MKKKKAVRLGRNSSCPCGSGLKYKKCCLGKKRPVGVDAHIKYAKKHKIRLKTKADIQAIRIAGKIALETLDRVEAYIRPGITTDSINTLVHDFTIKNGATPAPLNYKGFPKSVCVSINDVICHGIPGPRILQDGDIVNVDVTPILNGYYADVNKTFFVGNPGPESLKIVRVTRECLKAGIAMVRPGATLGDIGWAIQRHAHKNKCSVVEEFVGHGVGFAFHEPPQVLHYGRRKEGINLIPGMVFTIEPMINLGKKDLHVLDDGWTAVTDDHSLSAQFEQTILVTDAGYESLTPFEL
ncbi:type I methionyl aminopeptidase [Desulfococcaceae bacterium HSG9]|nr:type I methionyl aminopeptidase [Desulfococcaceae bacterium HSG9]